MSNHDSAREKELWDAYKNDRSDINRNRLVEYYYPVICQVAKHLARKEHKIMDVDDTIQEIAIAVQGLIEKFNMKKKTCFRSYIHKRIRGAAVDALRKLTGRRFIVDGKQVFKVNQVFASLDEPVFKDDIGTLTFKIDILSDPKQEPPVNLMIRNEKWEKLKEFCRTKRDYLTMLMYFRHGLNMREVGSAVGISEARVSQVMASMVEQVKDSQMILSVFSE